MSESAPASPPLRTIGTYFGKCLRSLVRHPLKSAASIVVVSGLTLLILEGALRALGLTNPILYERDPECGYRLKPNQQVRYFGNEIVVNEWGVRDPRPLKTKDPAKKRILVLGDSVTWGGILERQEHLFTSVAEAALRNVEIINAGVNGYSVAQMASLFRKQLRNLDPDIVLFCPIPRDFERPAKVQLSGVGVAFPLQRPTYAIPEALAICRQSAQDRFGWSWLRAPNSIITDTPSGYGNEEENVSAILGLASDLGATMQVGVAFAPTLGRQKLVGSMDEMTKRFRANHIPAARLRNMADFDTADFVDGIHLSTSGHEKTGKALAMFIQQKILSQQEQ